MRKLTMVVLMASASVCALAEGTRTWEQSTFEQFEKGTAKGVAIRNDGRLELAPPFQPVSTTPSTYIWAIAPGPEGEVYAAAGSPARVYRIASDGKPTIIFEPEELQVQALVVDPRGVVYAATSPDGKVYRIEKRVQAKPPSQLAPQEGTTDSSFVASVYFDPDTKYIWSLALDRKGELYVATGDRGEIFRVDTQGKAALFFKSDEAHIRALVFDAQGNLIAGSDGSGLVYRISPRGEGFVLYSATKKEITALAVDAGGNIYAAGVGDKRPAALPAGMPFTPVPSTSTSMGEHTLGQPGATTVMTLATGTPGAVPPSTIPLPGRGATGGSEIYQIAPDGSTGLTWSSKDDIVYALAFDGYGALLAGTGNRGSIYSLHPDGSFTDLLAASAAQVTAFARGPNGVMFVSTSNLGKVFLLGASPETEGSYESDILDATIVSRWGRVQVRGRGNYQLWARSGNVDNPDRHWSPWKKIDLAHDVPLDVPPARFIQWKAVLVSGNVAPAIEEVLLYYLPSNVAPVVENVTVQVGMRFLPAPKTEGPPPQPAPAIRDRGSIGVRWTAHDDNDDDLLFALYYRGDGETRWKLLKDKINDRTYSFDAGLLPDGGYTAKVIASDASSNSPANALSGERESARFEIDNTPPLVEDLRAVATSNLLHVTFRATDAFSVIRRAEYSIDAGDWQFIEPVGALSDAKTESYDFNVPLPAGDDEHTLMVRAYDRFENMGSAKVVVRAK